MEEANGNYLHRCPNTDDNYGPQVVRKGGKCPFCGEAAPVEPKIITSSGFKVVSGQRAQMMSNAFESAFKGDVADEK